VAEALRVKAHELGANIPYCEETKYRIGLGVEGQVNGYYLHVGISMRANLSFITAAVRKLLVMKLPSALPIRSLLLGTSGWRC
jgi:hypothetical protein